MKATLLILSLWAISTSLLAQADTIISPAALPNYIVLKNNDTIYKPIVEQKYIKNKPYLELDNKKLYPMADLSSYRDSNGVYRYYGRHWFTQEKIAKINTYSRTIRYAHSNKTISSGQMNTYYSGGHVSPTYISESRSYNRHRRDYFQVANETPKPYRYKYVKKAIYGDQESMQQFKSDQESMQLLKKGRRIENIVGTLLWSALAMSVSAIFIDNKPTRIAFWGSSAIIYFGVAPPIAIKLQDSYIKAVEVYNSHYPAGVH
jgi:hypothetical protein